MNIYSGITVKGYGRGAEIGFPTVNIKLENPPEISGVFAGNLYLNNQKYAGALFIGISETFENIEKTCEIHLFDFSEKISENTPVKLEIKEKIREIKQFANIEELKKAILADLLQVKKMSE